MIGFFVAPPRPVLPSVAFIESLDSDGSGYENFSIRALCQSLVAFGSQVRVYVSGSTAAVSAVDNWSIGIRSAGADTSATPVELKIATASGFSLAAGGAAVSDWANLTFSGTPTFVVTFDVAAANGAVRRKTSGAVASHYYKSATNSYNQSAVTGFTLAANYAFYVTKIEVR